MDMCIHIASLRIIVYDSTFLNAKGFSRASHFHLQNDAGFLGIAQPSALDEHAIKSWFHSMLPRVEIGQNSPPPKPWGWNEFDLGFNYRNW